MLQRLSISDFALLRKAEIYFSPGFSVFTGETGAGKSLLVGAVNFLGGQRAPFGVVREGARKAVVEGEFIRSDGSIVILRRELSQDGRSRSFLDDEPASAKEIADAAVSLLDITSQRAFSRLLDRNSHLDFLDQFAGLAEQRLAMERCEQEHSTLDRNVRRIRNLIEENARQREFYQHQLREIDAVAPLPGEDETILAELRRLEHQEEILQDSARVVSLLSDDPDSVDARLVETARLMERIGRFDEGVKELQRDIDSARSTLREAALLISSRCRAEEFDPDKLEALRERQRRLAGLARKFGGSLNAALERAVEFRGRLTGDEEAARELSGLKSRRDEILREWRETAAEVTRRRSEAGPRLASAVEILLRELGVPDAKIEVRLSRTAELNGLFLEQGREWRLTGRGVDEAEIFFSANPGMELKPVATTASGGELSRLLLAIKQALPATSDEATLLLDEIDSGVSGRIARLIGLKLRQLAGERQLLAITHLPQIASLADHHYRVRKIESEGTSATLVDELDGEDRAAEIAAMLSGGAISAAALQQAKHLMNAGGELESAALTNGSDSR